MTLPILYANQSISSISITKCSQSLLSPLLVSISFPPHPVFSSFSHFIVFFCFFFYSPVPPLLSTSLLSSSCFSQTLIPSSLFSSSFSCSYFFSVHTIFSKSLLTLFYMLYKHISPQKWMLSVDDIVVESRHLMHIIVHIHIHDELPIPYMPTKSISSVNISIMKCS